MGEKIRKREKGRENNEGGRRGHQLKSVGSQRTEKLMTKSKKRSND